MMLPQSTKLSSVALTFGLDESYIKGFFNEEAAADYWERSPLELQQLRFPEIQTYPIRNGRLCLPKDLADTLVDENGKKVRSVTITGLGTHFEIRTADDAKKEADRRHEEYTKFFSSEKGRKMFAEFFRNLQL